MRCPKSRFPIRIIVFDKLELIIFESQDLTLSTASLVSNINLLKCVENIFGLQVSCSVSARWSRSQILFFGERAIHAVSDWTWTEQIRAKYLSWSTPDSPRWSWSASASTMCWWPASAASPVGVRGPSMASTRTAPESAMARVSYIIARHRPDLTLFWKLPIFLNVCLVQLSRAWSDI